MVSVDSVPDQLQLMPQNWTCELSCDEVGSDPLLQQTHGGKIDNEG